MSYLLAQIRPLASVHLWSFVGQGLWATRCHRMKRSYADIFRREYVVVEGADPFCRSCLAQHYAEMERLREEMDEIRKLAYPMKASA